MEPPRIVTVFGSGAVEEDDPEYQKARTLGRLLAEAGWTVCNGGYGGIMEASARGAREAGGKTIGITTREFDAKANRWIREERKTATWRERLFQLIEMGHAYVLFDGGTGTLTELLTLWEMSNKKLSSKPILILGGRLGKLVQDLKTWPQIQHPPDLLCQGSLRGVMEILKGAKITDERSTRCRRD